ncbi:MAG: c-type cytochrome [Panacagrimonas sp.]
MSRNVFAALAAMALMTNVACAKETSEPAVVAAAPLEVAADATAEPSFPVPKQSSASTATATAAPAGSMPPIDRVKAAEKGSLKNPYNDTQAHIVEEGKKLWFSKSCNGCHGGGGGGGMCPPVSNETWIYGGDDDTLFRLVALGSVELANAGYARKQSENVKGPMVPFGALITTDDDLWKIITFIRSNYRGGPAKKYGNQAQPTP